MTEYSQMPRKPSPCETIRARSHLQRVAVFEVERLQRRQLAERLRERLQPLLVNSKMLRALYLQHIPDPRALSMHCVSINQCRCKYLRACAAPRDSLMVGWHS